MRRFVLLAVGLLAIVAAPAGCGGSGHSLSKAEYIRQADAICNSYSHELIKGTNSISLDPAYVSAWHTNLRRLRALHGPVADRVRVAHIWDEAEHAFTVWSRELKTRGVAAFNAEPAIFRREAADATAYGLHRCGT